MAQRRQKGELKVLILGETGSGKSSLGNKILGRDVFATHAGMSFKTNKLQAERAYDVMRNTDIRVIDTPDLEQFKHPLEDRENVHMWKAAADFSPDAILYTIRCDQKFTPEQLAKYKRVRDLWGHGFQDKLIVAFTFGDQRVKDIEKDIRQASDPLHQVLADAGQRYIVFSAKDRREPQVEQLLSMITPQQHSQPYAGSGVGAAALYPSLPTGQPWAAGSITATGNLRVVVLGDQTEKTALRGIFGSSGARQQSVIPLGDVTLTVLFFPNDVVNSRTDWTKMVNSKPNIILLIVKGDKKYSYASDLTKYREIKKKWGSDDFKQRLVLAFTNAGKVHGNIDEVKKQLGQDFEEVWRDAGHRHFILDDAMGQQTPQDFFAKLQAAVGLLSVVVPAAAAPQPQDDPMDGSKGAYSFRSNAASAHDPHYGTTNASVRHTTTIPVHHYSSNQDELCILVIGKAGTGKGSLCNLILGEERFHVAPGMTIQTRTAEQETATIDKTRVKVVITPDITNLKSSVPQEIEQWKRLTNGRPNAVLLTIRCDAKYTPEDYALYDHVKKLWPELFLYAKLIVVFTFGDKKVPDFDTDMKRAGSNLHSVLAAAQSRYIVVDNSKKSLEGKKTVARLLDLIKNR